MVAVDGEPIGNLTGVHDAVQVAVRGTRSQVAELHLHPRSLGAQVGIDGRRWIQSDAERTIGFERLIERRCAHREFLPWRSSAAVDCSAKRVAVEGAADADADVLKSAAKVATSADANGHCIWFKCFDGTAHGEDARSECADRTDLSGGSKHLELLFAGVAKTVVVAVFDVSRQTVRAVVDAVAVTVVASEFRVVVHAVGVAVGAVECDGVVVAPRDA